VTVLLDTDLLPETHRVDAVHAAYEGQAPRRTVVLGAGAVRHRIERTALGPDLHLLRTSGNALDIVRTARQVRADAPEHLALGWHRRGSGSVSTAGGGSDLPVFELNCVDMTRPYRLTHRTPHDHDVLIVANREAGVTVDVVRAAAPVLRRSPVYDLVRRHLAGLHRAIAGLPAEHRPLTGQATTTLLRALLTTAAETAGAAEAMNDTLHVRITAWLDTHLGDRDLTVERVAAVHAVSVRHLYDLWARAGHELTPAQWITDRRLQRAREHLTGAPDVSVAAVARRWGFRDASHFSRRFRQAFGVSPTEERAAARRAGRESAR
jgi:AraC family transcriptional regulator, positive regulator of tynA and feaB